MSLTQAIPIKYVNTTFKQNPLTLMSLHYYKSKTLFQVNQIKMNNLKWTKKRRPDYVKQDIIFLEVGF